MWWACVGSRGDSDSAEMGLTNACDVTCVDSHILQWTGQTIIGWHTLAGTVESVLYSIKLKVRCPHRGSRCTDDSFSCNAPSSQLSMKLQCPWKQPGTRLRLRNSKRGSRQGFGRRFSAEFRPAPALGWRWSATAPSSVCHLLALQRPASGLQLDLQLSSPAPVALSASWIDGR